MLSNLEVEGGQMERGGGDQPRGLQNNSMSEQDKKNVNKAKSHLIMSKEAKRKREAWDWQALRAQQMNGS